MVIYRDGCITEVAVLQRWLGYRGDLNEVQLHLDVFDSFTLFHP